MADQGRIIAPESDAGLSGHQWPQADPDLDDAMGTSSTDVYAVNRAGEIWHYNGSSWVSYGIPARAFVGVWGSSASDVWAVGSDDVFKNNKVYHGTR